jgi:hypothetical protein
MVVYFHTAAAIVAVVNGICSQVMDRDGRVIDDHPLRLHRLLGGVSDPLAAMDLRIDQGGLVPGLRLQFDFRGTTLTTEPIVQIEEAPSLSSRPRALSLPPSSRTPSQEPTTGRTPPPLPRRSR